MFKFLGFLCLCGLGPPGALSIWVVRSSVCLSTLTEATLWGGQYRIWCLVGYFGIVGCTSQYTKLKWRQRNWNEHFCWKGRCTPKNVSTILSKLGYVHMSNFRLAVGCIPHWLPSLDKICKHPIFSGSERYPTVPIYTHLIIHYPGRAKLSWMDSLVISVGCIPQRSVHLTQRCGLKLAPHSQDCGVHLIMYLW